ncbi:MAG TPA: hypothetical protein VIM28_02155 [Solirubrobacterales bacterium]
MSDDNRQPGEREGVLARVLGPDEPELSCEECFIQLGRYVELALADDSRLDEQVPGMRAHLEGCPACAEDYHSLRDLVSGEVGTGN